VAAIPARDWALTAEPSIGAVAVGIAFHQWEDFSWALVFCGVLGNGPPTLAHFARHGGRAVGNPDLGARVVRPGAVVSILAADLRIAAALLDLLVHLSSASMYPLRLASSLGFRTKDLRGQNIPLGLEPGCDFRRPAACGRRAVRRVRS
jgi:hypothetical protein